MAYLLQSVLLLGVSFLALRLYNHVLNRLRASRQGCGAPVRYPHWDPIFGLDLFIQTLRNVKSHNHVTDIHARHLKYGPTYHNLSLGKHVFNTVDPENIKALYSTSWTNWGVEPFRLESMKPFCGKGFITTDGDEWSRARGLLKPSFRRENVEDLSGFATMVEKWIDTIALKGGATVEVQDGLYHLFLDTAGLFLIGKGFDATQTQDQAAHSQGEDEKGTEQGSVSPAEFLLDFHAGEKMMGIRMIFGMLGHMIPTGKWLKQCKTVHDFIDDHIRNAIRKQNLAIDEKLTVDKEEQTKPKHSLLRSLVSQTDDPQDIRAQIIQGLMATQDTTSTVLGNIIFLLSRHPKWWERLREEALSFADPMSPNELKKSKLIQNITNEACRLYPPFPLHHRVALVPTTLSRGGGPNGDLPIFIPTGSRTQTCTWTTHRDPDVFGDDVETFDPDRWNRINPQPWEFMPFGYGARMCLGKDKARLEAAFVLVQIARRWTKCESRDTRSWKGEVKLSVRNVHGVRVGFIE